MEDLNLSPRLRLQVVLAVTNETVCQEERLRQEREARDLGLTGAEIDAARRGGSFDRHIASAVAYACALQHDDPCAIAVRRQQALADGSTPAELTEIEKLITYLAEMAASVRKAS